MANIVSTPKPEPLSGPVVTDVTPTTLAQPPSMAASSLRSSTPPPHKEQMFAYEDIDTKSFSGLAHHIQYGDQLLDVFEANVHLKQCVLLALERSVQETMPPVVERTLQIAIMNYEHIVKKDFALDPDEIRMRQAACYMIRNTISGLALYTCREPLFTAISNNIQKNLMTMVANPTRLQEDMIEQVAQIVAQINLALASAFIQKTAVERAIIEIEKNLAADFESRKIAREKGIKYCDPIVLTYQIGRMPEPIRLKVDGKAPKEIAVYDEFGRNIAGFLPFKE